MNINEPISVIVSYNHQKNTVMPIKIGWQNREYIITKLSYHHKARLGRTVFHIFHVTDNHLDFRIKLNTDDLSWILEEIYDQNNT